jgi:PIN domain nuclease of toxin-antitoxin system
MKSRLGSLLLDTHIWVNYINGDRELKAGAVAEIEAARRLGAAFVSVISVWEIAMLVQKRRLRLPLGVEGWVRRAFELPGVQLLGLSPEIAIESVQLSDEMHKDPADRILVASARVESLTLLTRDKAILRFAEVADFSFFRA